MVLTLSSPCSSLFGGLPGRWKTWKRRVILWIAQVPQDGFSLSTLTSFIWHKQQCWKNCLCNDIASRVELDWDVLYTTYFKDWVHPVALSSHISQVGSQPCPKSCSETHKQQISDTYHQAICMSYVLYAFPHTGGLHDAPLFLLVSKPDLILSNILLNFNLYYRESCLSGGGVWNPAAGCTNNLVLVV